MRQTSYQHRNGFIMIVGCLLCCREPSNSFCQCSAALLLASIRRYHWIGRRRRVYWLTRSMQPITSTEKLFNNQQIIWLRQYNRWNVRCSIRWVRTTVSTHFTVSEMCKFNIRWHFYVYLLLSSYSRSQTSLICIVSVLMTSRLLVLSLGPIHRVVTMHMHRMS